jgi:hypothetical protein
MMRPWRTQVLLNQGPAGAGAAGQSHVGVRYPRAKSSSSSAPLPNVDQPNMRRTFLDCVLVRSFPTPWSDPADLSICRLKD